VLEAGQVVYHETPEQMAVGLPALLDAGARIIGGCCGSTPDHIRAFRSMIDARAARR
jgi:5-methyltetrahydrofolate--homocysteine methyltransferase